MGFSVADIVVFGKSEPVSVTRKKLPADKLLAGDADITNTLHYRDAAGNFTSGIWECTPCSFRACYDEDEFYFMLEGEVVIRDDHGGAATFVPGDCIVVPAGFTGSWDVVKFTRKFYAHSRPVSTSVLQEAVGA